MLAWQKSTSFNNFLWKSAQLFDEYRICINRLNRPQDGIYDKFRHQKRGWKILPYGTFNNVVLDQMTKWLFKETFRQNVIWQTVVHHHSLLLTISVNNLDHISGPSKCQVWSGSKLFLTLWWYAWNSFLKKKRILKKFSRWQKAHQKFPACKMYGKYSKISNTSCLPKRLRQTGHTQIRLLLKNQSDQDLPFCFSGKRVVNSSPDNRHFIWE